MPISLVSNVAVTFVARPRPSGLSPTCQQRSSDTCMTCFLGLYGQNTAGRQPCLLANPLPCPCQLALKSGELLGLLGCCLFIQMIFRKALPLPSMTLMTGGSAQGDQGDRGGVLGPSEQRKKLGTVVLEATERKPLRPLFLDPPAPRLFSPPSPKEYSPLPCGYVTWLLFTCNQDSVRKL